MPNEIKLHNAIVANQVDKISDLLSSGANPFALIHRINPRTGEKEVFQPPFLTALRRDSHEIVTIILRHCKPDLSESYPVEFKEDEELPTDIDFSPANWLHKAAFNTSPECMELLREHQNTFPGRSFKVTINRPYHHFFEETGKCEYTRIGHVLLRRISLLDARFDSSTYGSAGSFATFRDSWLFSEEGAHYEHIEPTRTVAVRGATRILAFLLKNGLNKDLSAGAYTLQHLADTLHAAFSSQEAFAIHEKSGLIIWDRISRISKVHPKDGGIAFAIKVRNALGANETRFQIVIDYSNIRDVVKHTVEDPSLAVQHLETRVGAVEEDVADLKHRMTAVEAKLAKTKDEQFKAALNKYRVGSQYRVAFQGLHTRIHALVQQTLDSTSGVYSTEMSSDANVKLGFISLFGLASTGGQGLNPAAAVVTAVQVCMRALVLYRETTNEKRRVYGVESAMYKTESEAHILATCITDGLMQMAEKVYGQDITEKEAKDLVTKLFSRVNGQVNNLAGKEFASPFALVCHLSQTAAAHLKGEYTKLQSGATVLEFGRPKKGSGGSGSTPTNGSDEEGSPKTAKPVKKEVIVAETKKKGGFLKRMGFV